MSVRVRYAPSPTGLQHIGGVRTALFNYLFARANGGSFILRLEDTDRARTSDAYVRNLYDTFSWLGIHWDEGPDVGGPKGPYVQSERFELYRAHARSLLESGKAYPCFCGEDRLVRMRSDAEPCEGEGAPTYGYDRACREIAPASAARRAADGEPHVIRLKIPLGGTTRFRDLLLGEIEWRNQDISPDPVLLKSDGFPTYHLANVVDDHLMEISHVMRAQEWIPSAPLHMILYEAFGWKPPALCHLPMVLGPDGHKLSKRHGATAVNEFRDKGYIPEALINYVAMLGASYEDGRDLYSLEDLARLFHIERINKAPAVFDYVKLDWFNGQYIRALPDAELTDLIRPYAVASGLFGGPEAAPDASQERIFQGAVPLVKERIARLDEAPSRLSYLFSEPPPAPVGEFIPRKLDSVRAAELLGAAAALLPACDLADIPATEERFR
ncbi:MAG TPA: glutamate--tRNA ligase, partial [Magnetospirillaceae bacterium]|nr:glutamate--tRNA ligase [Magnetospirillaceae bacterium]